MDHRSNCAHQIGSIAKGVAASAFLWLTLGGVPVLAEEAPSPSPPSPGVTISAKDQPMCEVISRVLDGTQLKCEIDNTLPCVPVTLSLKNVSRSIAMRLLVREAGSQIRGLSLSRSGDTFRISVKETPRKPTVAKPHGDGPPAEGYVYRAPRPVLRHGASARAVEKLLGKPQRKVSLYRGAYETWYYGQARLKFADGKLIDYKQGSGKPLPVDVSRSSTLTTTGAYRPGFLPRFPGNGTGFGGGVSSLRGFGVLGLGFGGGYSSFGRSSGRSSGSSRGSFAAGGGSFGGFGSTGSRSISGLGGGSGRR